MSSILHIDCCGTKYWSIGGICHRIGGPSVEYKSGTKYWFLYGIELMESDYNKEISNLPLLYWNRFKKGEWL